MSGDYKVSVRPQHERREFISTQVATSQVGTYTSYDVYEGATTPLPIIRLPLGLPIYRMANGRTQTHQLAFIAEKKYGADYFQSGEENETAQQIQHEILRKFAREGSESITPIIDELERTRQTEPLLITPAGVVVNGNRRMAAMRELYADRQADFPTFANVQCAVLPTLTPEQVDDLEIRLQMTPETKLPYGWIDECLKIKKQMTAGRKEDEIARVMRKKKNEITRALSALNFSEIYLKDWCKKPRDYRAVEAGEQFFHDLVTRLRGKDGALLDANMKMAWILFDNRQGLGGRIYDFNKVLGEKATEVLASLADRLEIDSSTSSAVGETMDDLEINLGDEETTGTSYSSLIAALDDEERREEIADALRAVCQTIIDAKKTAQEGSSAVIAIRDANTRLAEVDLTRADPKTYDGIDRQLDEIVRRASELKDKIKTYKSSGGSTEKETQS
jgi:hypothetical protein